MMMASAVQSSMRLSRLLEGLASVAAQNDPVINGVALDSRRLQAGDLFIALSGARCHGREYINDAVQAGAAAILLEADSQQVGGFPGAVPVITLSDLRQQVGEIAARFYQHPSRTLRLMGVTGTNGKTSVCQMLAYSLQKLQHNSPCGVIGTLGYGLYGECEPAANTTPDAITLNQLLTDMLARGARHTVMEVSSHGLQQGRVSALHFDTAIFTNLSRDHLDYHGNMHAYGLAKKALFQMPGLRNAVINLDDAFGRELLENLSSEVRVFAYSMQRDVQFARPYCEQMVHAQLVSSSREGLQLMLQAGDQEASLTTRLIGEFNTSNLLACVAALLSQDFELVDIVLALETVPVVPGRLEVVPGEAQQPLVIVDYAHTPDGLKQALGTLRKVCTGRLICVFGCGGDRDRGKRPLMGKIGAELADHLILTNDNPRSENPARILSDITSGITDLIAVEQIPDRSDAIRAAITQANAQDVVLIAGKGHEDYQIVGDEVLAFSDREQVRSLINEVQHD